MWGGTKVSDLKIRENAYNLSNGKEKKNISDNHHFVFISWVFEQ